MMTEEDLDTLKILSSIYEENLDSKKKVKIPISNQHLDIKTNIMFQFLSIFVKRFNISDIENRRVELDYLNDKHYTLPELELEYRRITSLKNTVNSYSDEYYSSQNLIIDACLDYLNGSICQLESLIQKSIPEKVSSWNEIEGLFF